MKYNELNLLTSQKSRRRAGRGISAGQGKTAGRGTKGQGSRKSGGVRPGFEGGQMPLYMRLPKLRGVKGWRTKPAVVYLDQLESVKKVVVDNQVLYEAGIVSDPHLPIKLLNRGELKAKKDVKLQSASQSAQTALAKAGGSFTAGARVGREKKSQPPVLK